MKTGLQAIILMVLCTLFISAAQILLKLSVESTSFNNPHRLLSLPFVGGLLLYAFGAVLLFLALRKGQVSTVYPIITTSYVWVTLLAAMLFNESISLAHWIGIILIMVGISLVALGEQENQSKEAIA